LRLSVRPKLEDVPIARYEIVRPGGLCAFDNFVIVRIILHYRQSFRGLNAIRKTGEVISEGVDIRLPKGKIEYEQIEVFKLIRQHQIEKLKVSEMVEALAAAGIHTQEHLLRNWAFKVSEKGLL